MKLYLPIFSLFLLGYAQNSPDSQEKYALLQVRPHDQQALQILRQLQLNDFKYELDFWKSPSRLSDEADIMVKRGKPERMLRKILEFTNSTISLSVPDVEKLILRNEHRNLKSSFSKILKDDPILDSEPDADLSKVGQLKKAKYPFGDYASYAEMVKYMRTIEFYYPKLAKIVRIGQTHEGKPIEGLKIGAHSPFPKRAIWVDGNIHAREWASSHTALFFINQLVSNYNIDPQITNYLNTLDFYILPCLNPDGYEYTRSSPIPSVRLWRKNRSPEVCRASLWGGEKCCQGVDLNRNFRFHWSERGSSYEPCGSQFLSSPELRDRVDAFITLHSYAQLWIYPYSHEEQNYPEDIGELRKTARKAINRLSQVYGTSYRMGTGADTLSPAAGGSDDWAKSALNVKYVYLIELRPQMELSNGFILHKKELIPTAVETFEGFREVVDAVLTMKNNATTKSTSTSIRTSSKSTTTTSASTLPSTTRKTISDLQMKKQQYRMRLLASQQGSSSSTIASRHFARFTPDPTSTERSRPTPPQAPPVLISTSTTSREEGSTTLGISESSSSDPESSESTSLSSSSKSSDSNSTPFAFFTATKPSAFLDPECRDMRYSCSFWLKNNKNVCTEQESFMRAQCAFTCKFCVSFIKRI
ncbi:unnamed protein product [Caenorhabditis angaria]|uniref:ShKT domain-containing protein n=1 Tax=Caenorhabditis angaria TaxID=860376 RepID=A0A9P1MTA0_9PELO|nr:unnamed protein product [Caenorhabditis angaria]